ncbi:4-oxalocrotonate tautomerase DmpI [Dialister sp.]|uniref:4-oxalocrotonate tautomerase DmpI n=1 Tax=Dialister sp. TaxID=1955814 RepID=UPI003F055DFF
MPFIKVETAKASREQKEKLIADVTRAASEALGIPQEAFYMVVNENSTDNWGIGGKTLTNLNKKS